MTTEERYKFGFETWKAAVEAYDRNWTLYIAVLGAVFVVVTSEGFRKRGLLAKDAVLLATFGFIVTNFVSQCGSLAIINPASDYLRANAAAELGGGGLTAAVGKIERIPYWLFATIHVVADLAVFLFLLRVFWEDEWLPPWERSWWPRRSKNNSPPAPTA